MFKKYSASALVIVSIASFSVAAVNFDNPKAGRLADEINNIAIDIPIPGKAEKRKAATVKEWTIMVFVNGRNNLEENALKDINEMEMVGSSDQVNIVVQVARIAGYNSSDGDWETSRRYFITKDDNVDRISSPVLLDLGKVDMGDYRNVIAFGKWAKAAYPARKAMLIIWDHGTGWVKSKEFSGGGKGISYDAEARNHINTPQIAAILKGIGGVDVYGSDACLMQMAEVVYEIKDHVKFIVGSEEASPGDGYPYNSFLAQLVAKPGMGGEALARLAVEAYANYYQANGEGSTQSYVRSSAIPGFLNAVNDLASAITMADEKDLAGKARGAAQAYRDTDNKDLYHFAQLIAAGTNDASVKEKSLALMAYMEKELIGYNRANNGSGGSYWLPPVNHLNSHGLSIYLPSSVPASGYEDLQWAKYSNWDEFIKWYQAP